MGGRRAVADLVAMAMAPPHPLQPARSSLRAPPPFSRFSRRALLHADAVCAAAAAPHRLFVFSSLIVGIAVGARGAASGGSHHVSLWQSWPARY